MRFGTSLIASLGITYWSTCVLGQTVSAETALGAAAVPRLTVAATALAGMSFGYHCEPSATVYGACSHQSTLVGLRILPRVRLRDDWGFGFSMGVVRVSQADLPASWWDWQAAARYYLGHTAPSQLWIDASLGAVLASQRPPAPQPYQPGVDYVAEPRSTAFTWAPAASLAVGYDFQIVRFFGFAPEVRISHYGLNGHGPGAGTDYKPQTVVTLGVSVVGFGAYR